MRHRRNYTQYVEGEQTVLSFGKHRGETVGQIIRDDPQYMLWLYEEHIISMPSDLLFRVEDRVDSDNGLDHNYSSYYDD